MIATATELLGLLADESPESVRRIRHDTAPAEVWLEVLQRAPEHADTVALNKALPLTVLRVLAKSEDSRVRFAVVQKKRLSSDLLTQLATDPDEGIRLAVAEHRNTAQSTLRTLATDSWDRVRDAAERRLEDKSGS
ncbi:hypothetical protein G5C66_02690 [Nocardioides sp. KC13]|uniref:HEAT repeat domain-containing protein n=2 Tax=Nocardioides turkmenicus TaxID=2711220 RepID=A0A6M1R543_9ACTN|nr:hypothetical protein [Nocardioides sp. KC13]